jgi:hypothetical protein
MRERHFIGINFKSHKALENAQPPTTLAPAYFAPADLRRGCRGSGARREAPSQEAVLGGSIGIMHIHNP